MLILVLNPGSTSLKLAVFQDETLLHEKSFRFPADALEQMKDPNFRASYCRELIDGYLAEEGLSAESLDCVVASGGVLGKVNTGAYRVNEKMIEFVHNSPARAHSIGVVIAYDMMNPLGKPSLIYDAVTADEWDPIAKVTGIKGYEKPAQQHTLNCRRIMTKLSERFGKPVGEINAIVSHLGGGIDTSFFREGRLVETMGFNELGFTPERCGAIHFNDLLKMTKTKTFDELQPLNRGKGGLMSHFGTVSVEAVEAMIDAGDETAALVLEAMAYRIAQCIGAGAVALEGKIDAIVLTGGIAHSKRFTEWIIRRVDFLGPIIMLPGEFEIEALAAGARRVLLGEEEVQEY